MVQVGFPFALENSGRTGSSNYPDHIRALMVQLLFTDPGERVNRPAFGAGVRSMIFEGGNPETFAAARFLIQSSLEEWLGDLIEIEAVEVEGAEEETSLLHITVQYTIRRTDERQTTRFTG